MSGLAMYTTYIVRRTQIYLDEKQDRALEQRARSEGITRSAVIRDAIEQYLAPSGDERVGLDRLRAAVREAAGTAPYLPSGAEYVDEIRAGDVVRERELAERRS
jgi:hypothetical protein